ncbi:MAG: argininosuccinate synthase [Phycisphaerales bacterium]|nr:argininosuccinate synthase [Phycisphaerales bacterium]
MAGRRVVLAFSGGLDTSYCVAWLREAGYEVHTVSVQTGGFDPDELGRIEARAIELGAETHQVIDAREELFERSLKYLIFGNCLRGGAYPLCVSAERMAQARHCAAYALEVGAVAIAHGSTGAGNDQARFDIAFRCVAPRLEILTPIRSQGLSREQTTGYLRERGFEVQAKTTKYSINRGLWGVTIGGGDTHRSETPIPEEAYVITRGPGDWPGAAREVEISFEQGVPVALNGERIAPVALLEALELMAAEHGIGRGTHVGDTILGIKGRIAFEAPAAVTLIAAHRELEKLVLSRQQAFWKQTLGELYGAMTHEARYFDPLARDLEAFLASSQRHVTGKARVKLFAGQANVVATESPYSMMNPEVATYGETARTWNGAEAAAFVKLYGLQDMLAQRAAAIGDAASGKDER